MDKRECPTCGLMVRVKVDGTLGSHRVGTRKNAYLCPGETQGKYAPKGQ